MPLSFSPSHSLQVGPGGVLDLVIIEQIPTIPDELDAVIIVARIEGTAAMDHHALQGVLAAITVVGRPGKILVEQGLNGNQASGRLGRARTPSWRAWYWCVCTDSAGQGLGTSKLSHHARARRRRSRRR